jgi:hypothetical protein
VNSNQLLVIGDQLDDLLEAVGRAGQRSKMERLIRPLEVSLRKAFREQGSLMGRKFRQVKHYFSESGNPWQQYDAWMNSKFIESVPASEWLKILADVQLSTVKLFSTPIDAAVAKALELGGIAMFAELGMKVSFSLSNPRAVDYLKDYGAELVKGINETTRDTLQTLITQATEEGWSYKKTAEAIIARFDEFAVGTGQAHIDSRAHLIAVTETGNAYEQGNFIVAQDLQDAGLTMEKSWSTVGDVKVSEGCKTNEAEGWIGIDQAHSSGHQRPLRFPGCRCEERYRMKEEK